MFARRSYSPRAVEEMHVGSTGIHEAVSMGLMPTASPLSSHRSLSSLGNLRAYER